MMAHRIVGTALLALASFGCDDGAQAGQTPDSGPTGKADDADGADADAPVRVLDQGWDAEQRQRMYRLSEGSEIMPTRWFVALGSSRGERFVDRLPDYGFIADAASDANPEGLPVGFAQTGDFVGVTCTACHTGELEIDGTRIRIDGATMRADFARMQLDLLETVRDTLASEKDFEVFAAAVGKDPGALREEVQAWAEDNAFRLSFAEGAIVPGPGRLDGVGQATNETLCIDFDFPDACDTFNAPSSPGFLWGLGDLSWVQANGSVHNAIARNTGQAMGTFGQTSLEGPASSSAPLLNLVWLEEGFEELRPPRWDDPAFEGLLPDLDEGSLERGAEIFARTCAGCHASRETGPFTQENAFGKAFIEVPVTPLSEIGTDPGWVADLLEKRVLPPPGFIEARAEAYGQTFGTTDPSVPVPSASLRAMVIAEVLQQFMAANAEALEELGLARFASFRESGVTRRPEELMGYRAQPLEGIAFTAPYLHNGSVPTLADLLEPKTGRPKEFLVGGATFDPDLVGFETSPDDPNAYRFDTDLPGNSNAGHEGPEYGTTLGDDEKADLLAYLKSL